MDDIKQYFFFYKISLVRSVCNIYIQKFICSFMNEKRTFSIFRKINLPIYYLWFNCYSVMIFL